MGLNFMCSSSFVDDGYRRCLADEEIKSLPNPKPDNYKVLRTLQMRNFLIIEIQYLDCTNYEGRKIMIYEGICLADLKAQKSIDPHFTENKNYHSPIARFEPTKRGWEMAEFFVNKMNIFC